jgi:general secretion pathway protein F
MLTFRYKAFTEAGDLAEGEIEAHSSAEAEETLWRRGLTPFETREAPRGGESLSLRLLRKRGMSAAELASFTREFATLEQAEIPLDQSLRLLSSQGANPAMRELASGILGHVVDGASLSDALSRRPEIFADDYLNVVRAGEAMGNVGAALGEIAEMLERRVEMRARIQSALIYPIILIVLAMVSTAVVLGSLVPNIAPIFADSGKPMPSGLQFIIDAQAHWPWIVGFFVALVIFVLMLRAYAATRPDVQAALADYALRVPYVGPLRAQLETARFARTLGAMMHAGVPLLQGLESARSVISNVHMRNQTEQVIDAVRGGANLSAALGHIDRLPTVAAQMVSIGEEAGKLDGMLLRVAVMFERQTQRSIERVIGMLTPALTVGIAIVVGGLIMTVMNAVLGINEMAMK